MEAWTGQTQGQGHFCPILRSRRPAARAAGRRKENVIRTETVQLLKPGIGRVEPICPHFGKCGGCQLQQLEYMRQWMPTADPRGNPVSPFPETRDLPVVMRACTQPFGYRSRARVQLRGAGQKASVGFYRHRSHAVEDLENCPLLLPLLNEALIP